MRQLQSETPLASVAKGVSDLKDAVQLPFEPGSDPFLLAFFSFFQIQVGHCGHYHRRTDDHIGDQSFTIVFPLRLLICV